MVSSITLNGWRLNNDNKRPTSVGLFSFFDFSNKAYVLAEKHLGISSLFFYFLGLLVGDSLCLLLCCNKAWMPAEKRTGMTTVGGALE